MPKMKLPFHRWKKEEGYFMKEGKNYESTRSAIAIFKERGNDISVESRFMFPNNETKKELEKISVEIEFIIPKKIEKEVKP